MALPQKQMDLIVGVALIVVGILLLIGRFSIGSLIPIAGLVLVILGILILTRTLPGGTLVGVVALVVGILLLGNWVPFPENLERSMRDVMDVLNVIIGVLALIFGIMKVMRH